MIKFKFIILGFFITIMSSLLHGQNNNYESKHYSFKNGLPGRLVLDVIQEETGLIWLATENGLARYDGYEFLTFNNFNYSFDIAGTDFQIDIQQNHANELAVFHGYPDLSFETFDLNNHENWKTNFSDFSTPPLAIFNQKEGFSYFVFEEKDKITVFKLLENQIFQKLFTTNLPANNIEKIDLFVDNAGDFWLNYNNQEWLIYNEQGQLKKTIAKSKFGLNVTNLEWMFIHQDGQNNIWLALRNQKGVFQYDAQNNTFELQGMIGKSDYFSNVWEDNQGNLLFKGARHQSNAYVESLICVQPNGEQVAFDNLANSYRTINNIHANNFFEQVIIAAPNGLIILNQKPSVFQHLLSVKLAPGDWGRSIRGITGDNKGNIFLGTETNELFQYNLAKDSVFQLPLKNIYATENRKYFGGRNIFLDEEEQIWSLSNNSEQETYFHRYNLKTKKTTSKKIDGITPNFMYDGNRFFYLTVFSRMKGSGKLVVFDTKRNTFSNWKDGEGKDLILNARARSIAEIENGILWIGTIDGLLKIDLNEKTTDLISLNKENGELFENQEVMAIYPTEEGIWLGTSKGLVLMDRTSYQLKETYEEKDGLVSNSVCGILPDSLGNLWISTFNGLSFFDRKQQRFNNFYESDGLSHYEFNRQAFYIGEAGKFYFGGMNGVNLFDAQELLKTRAGNRLILTKYTKSYADQDSQTVQVANLDNLDNIVLPANYSHFELHFAMPNFLSKEIRYSAWLKNYEKDWNFLGNNPKVRYNKLPAGNYQLHLKAVDAKGNPAQNQLLIPISIKEIFYKQIWFQLLMIACLMLLVWGIAQYHAAQKLKVERLRTKLSSDLHDEVSGLLAGIAMQTDLMQMSIEEEAHKSKLAKIGTTSRSAMSRMGDVIWSVDARKDKFEDLLLRMQEHTAEVLQPLGIDYQFEIGKFNVNKKIGLKLRQNLYLIFKESINNIAKHSTASKATISIENKGNLFQLRIKDNGEAKEKSTSYKTGQGLSNLKMRSKEIQGKLSIYSKNGFEVILKVRKFA